MTLTLAVSGKLWENNLVMVDRETETLWSQLLGEAMSGELTGAKLQQIPSVMTDWGTWKSRYPQTTVVLMPRSSSSYDGTFHSWDNGLVIGLTIDGQSRDWDLGRLYSDPIVNDELAGTSVLVTFDPKSFSTGVFDRTAKGRMLNFEMRQGKLVDSETDSEWDIVTAKATSGPLKGTRLQRLPAIVSDSATWIQYHPFSPEETLERTR